MRPTVGAVGGLFRSVELGRPAEIAVAIAAGIVQILYVQPLRGGQSDQR